MTFKTLSIGEAVRVHMRCDDNLVYYRRYRRAWFLHKHMSFGDAYLREAMVARARWTVLQEIIEAEERRQGRAA